MKITLKHIQYILILLIVVIAVVAYYLGFLRYIEKAEQIRNSNKTIEARISELNDKESHRTEWNESISQVAEDAKVRLAKYGPGNTPEKSIMFVRALENATGLMIPSISFGADTVLYLSNEVDENGNPKIELNTTTLSINYASTYDGLKKCIDYINHYPERMNIYGFSANYNQDSGQLSGSMVINLYGIKDADHVYTDPSISGVKIGVDNIFGTME